MSPRIILLSITGILLYLFLSIYHGHLLKQLPELNGGNSLATLTKAGQEKNWVQVSTSPGKPGTLQEEAEPDQEQSAASSGNEVAPVQTQPAESVAAAAPTEGRENSSRQQLQTAGEEQVKLLQALEQEQEKSRELAMEKENLLFRIDSLQADLQKSRNRMLVQEEELKDDRSVPTDPETESLKKSVILKNKAIGKANERIESLAKRLEDASSQLIAAERTIAELGTSLGQEQEARVLAENTAGRLQAEVDLSRSKALQQLTETGRLQAQIKEMRSRLRLLEDESRQATLKAEAMLRYGQEQTKLTTPFRQEIEILNARLQDGDANLVQAEQTIAELRDAEQTLQVEFKALQEKNRQNQVELEQMKNAGQTLEESRKHAEELDLMLKELGNQLNERETRIATLTSSVDEAEAARLAAEQKSAVLDGEAAGLKQQMQELESRNQNLQARLDETLLSLQGLEVTSVEAEKKATVLSEQSTLMQNQLESAMGETDALKASLDDATRKLQSLEASLREKESLITEQEQKLLSASQSDSQAGALAEQLQEKDALNVDLQKKLSGLGERIAAMEEQQQTTVAALAAGEEDNRRLSAQLQQAETEKQQLAATAGELAENKRLTDQLQEETASLNSELERRENAYFTLQEELSALQMQYDKLTKDHDRLLLLTTDSDSDGVPDSDDTCADTVNGSEVDEQGCELDSDADGIVNRLDLCPDTASGTDIDQLGCPPDQPVILRSVTFESGTAELSPETTLSLDKLVAVLQHMPSLRIEIGGHTDSIGEEERNLEVSRQRAEAVSGYLVARGIATDRVTAVGYGPQHPVADNDTVSGRASNRRVELKIIPAAQE